MPSQLAPQLNGVSAKLGDAKHGARMQIALAMNEKIETWFWRAVAIGGASMQLWGSSKTGNEVSIAPPWDKVIHGAAFGVLAYVCCLGAGRWKQYAFWLVPLGVGLFAATDEWHQSLTPRQGRRAGKISQWTWSGARSPYSVGVGPERRNGSGRVLDRDFRHVLFQGQLDGL